MSESLKALVANQTPQERLAMVRLAIAQVLSRGQSNAFAGQTMSRAQLDTLRSLERDYLAECTANERGGRTRIIYAMPDA